MAKTNVRLYINDYKKKKKDKKEIESRHLEDGRDLVAASSGVMNSHVYRARQVTFRNGGCG